MTIEAILPKSETEMPALIPRIQNNNCLWSERRVLLCITDLPKNTREGKMNFKNYTGSNSAATVLSLESYCQKSRGNVCTLRLDASYVLKKSCVPVHLHFEPSMPFLKS